MARHRALWVFFLGSAVGVVGGGWMDGFLVGGGVGYLGFSGLDARSIWRWRKYISNSSRSFERTLFFYVVGL